MILSNPTVLCIKNSMSGDTLFKAVISTDNNDFKEGKEINVDGENYVIVDRSTSVISNNPTGHSGITIELRVYSTKSPGIDVIKDMLRGNQDE